MIDLLLTVAIIGILTSIAAPAFQKMADRSRAGVTAGQLYEVVTFIKARRDSGDDLTLIQMTGSPYTIQCYVPAIPYKNQTTGIACSDVSRTNLGYSSGTLFDGYGNPILMDENELEFSPTDCRYDVIISPGKDGVASGDNTATLNVVNLVQQGSGGASDPLGDDIVIAVPHESCPNANGPVTFTSHF